MASVVITTINQMQVVAALTSTCDQYSAVAVEITAAKPP
jgi:hypothetical protein